MVDAWPAEAAEQTTATDNRPPRPLFGMETEPVVGSLASKWSAVELEIGCEGKVLADYRVQKPCPNPRKTF
jgi:hypothetical protein